MKESIYAMDVPVTIALLGDMHGEPYGQVVGSLRENRPGIIAVAGDIVYGHQPKEDVSPLVSQANILPFLTEIARIAPTFLSLGNHEWMLDEEDLEQIRGTGVTVLDNSWVMYNGLVIGGLTSAVVLRYRRYRRECQQNHPQNSGRYPEPAEQTAGDGVRVRKSGQDDNEIQACDNTPKPSKKPDLSWLPAFLEAEGCHVLLNHHPEYYPLLPRGIELVLSCHAHGGQWRFFNPFRFRTQGLYAPGQGLFPKWTRGVYDNRLVVSAGLANTTRIPRLFNPTEVVYIRP